MIRVAAVALAALAAAGCRDRGSSPATSIGDVDRGRALVRAYGCHTCHTIPGIVGADATVGPPLDRVGRRVYVGGRLNSPAALVEWLLDPPAVDPHTPMPNLGVTPEDAHDLAAFLYTLR